MNKHLTLIILLLLLNGCATQRAKYAPSEATSDVSNTKEKVYTFYLIGDAGLSPMGEMNPALKTFKKQLDRADSKSMAVFLGDNIYPAGLPDKKDSTRAYVIAKNHLDAQLQTLENFKGKPLFIPGNHDWYTEGLKGLERQEKYIQKKLDDKDAFLPKDGCPVQEVAINEQVSLIAIDSEWYLTNWDKRPDINDKCEIKSREKFLEVVEDLIKDNRQKTTLIALHHPMFSYGPHGGQYSFKKHLYPKKMAVPIPVLGTFINVLRRTTGASIADMQSKPYRELKNRLVTLAQYSDKVIFVSGHEHTLQYIVEENTPQIVSGSGAKTGESRLLNGSKFSTGEMGYATLEVYEDGSSRVRYYGLDEDDKQKFLYTSQVLPPDREGIVEKYEVDFPPTVAASVYTEEEVDKSGFFKTLWGERYRKYYATKVQAPTVLLDTLYGGLTPVSKGGGHQSKSLRLRHKNGQEYVMRAIKKSAELYLQAMAFKDQYIIGQFEDTYTEGLLEDFYTGAHPYAPFTVGKLSDAVGLYHTNPVLYYVPKQAALEDFNKEFGDELYMIEEHAGDGHGALESFGYANELVSTDDLLEALRDDERYMVDSRMYLRARLFDMVIGDWDRHVDQWRWAKFKDKESGKIIFRPFPRDRDQAYSIMGDGALMGLATRIIPSLRLMEGFNEEIRNVAGFNSSPMTYVLDMALLPGATKEEWQEEANYIRRHITPEIVDEALMAFPKEVRDESVERIKKILLARAAKITETAAAYYGVLNKYAVVTGTDKDDWFVVNRLNKKETEISVYRIIDGKKQKQFFNKKFDNGTTREIWLYGLDDDDYFETMGNQRNTIKIRFVGGPNNDTYAMNHKGNNVFIYDQKSKKNTLDKSAIARVRLTDDYELNTYRPLNIRNSTNQIIPTVGYNPDDGFKIGISDTYTYNGFRQNPFTQRHIISGAFYFATNGFDLGYRGEFANISEHWNLEIAARFTSPNFSINFFGFGNESLNPDDELDLDYNRVRIRTLKAAPSMVWRGARGAKFRMGLSIEGIEVEETEGRFINTFYQSADVETENKFWGVDAEYAYSNTDNEAFPTMGMATMLLVGYKSNLDDGTLNYGYVIPSLSFDYKLVPSGRVVLATKWKAHFNIGDGYEFYQGASIGASDGLRGFRNQRFTGKTSYYQNTDLRWSLRSVKTGLLPLTLGIYGGFDYGRVWFPADSSNSWHTSYGGGLFVNGADVVTATLAVFGSDDGPRFSFGLGFGF